MDIKMIDSSSIRVRQHAANTKDQGSRCMGRSRGGLSRSMRGGVAIRYDVRADNSLAGIKLASFWIWYRYNESMTVYHLQLGKIDLH